MRIAVSGVRSAGFSTTVLPAASAGAKPHEAIGIGKFQGTMIPDDADRLVEGDVHAPRDRDLAPEEPLRRPRVVGEHVADVARLPAGVRDRVAGVRHLESRQLLVGPVHDLREAAQQPGPIARRDGPPSREGGGRAGDRLVGRLGAEPG